MAFSQETSGAKRIFFNYFFFLSQLCVIEQSLPSGAQEMHLLMCCSKGDSSCVTEDGTPAKGKTSTSVRSFVCCTFFCSLLQVFWGNRCVSYVNKQFQKQR